MVLLLLAVLVPLLMIVTAPIFLLIWVIGFAMAIGSGSFRKEMNVTRLGMALWLPFWVVVLIGSAVPSVALAHAAVLWLDGHTPSLLPTYLDMILSQLPQVAREFVADLNVSRRDWGWFCVFAGVTGVSSNFVYAFIDIPWRLKQIRLVRALPRSKARSAAIGLAEFEGTIRAASPDGYVSKSPSDAVQPFHLEDETGRILVDPRGATVRLPSGSGAALQANEIEGGLRHGDHVYVIGNVQCRDDAPPGAADSGSLVVRPLGQALVSSPVARMLFAKGDAMTDRDTPNIFIVDKGHEHDVTLRLRTTLWDFCAIGAIYLASSLWLVQAAWPWLA